MIKDAPLTQTHHPVSWKAAQPLNLSSLFPPDPTFVHAHLIPDSGEKNDDKLYFFFREKASEVGQSPMTQSRIGRICLVSLSQRQSASLLWTLEGSHLPHNVSEPGQFPTDWPAQHCNAHQYPGRKQKCVLSASAAAKFGSCVVLFQLLGMKWLSERVPDPGLAGWPARVQRGAAA